MLLFLIAGFACLMMFGFQLTRARAPKSARGGWRFRAFAGRAAAAAAPVARRSIAHRARNTGSCARAFPKALAPADTTMSSRRSFARAGASRRFSAELFMALRVTTTLAGFILGFLTAHGGAPPPRTRVRGCGDSPARVPSQQGSVKARREIDAALPHFVDQLALLIEAGMSFDAAVTYLADAARGRSATRCGAC